MKLLLKTLMAVFVLVAPCAAQVNVQGSSIQIGGVGGGGNPGGALYQGQMKTGDSTFGGLPIFSDASGTHTETYIPPLRWTLNSTLTSNGNYIGGKLDCAQTIVSGTGNEGHQCEQETTLWASKGWYAGNAYSTNGGWMGNQVRNVLLQSYTSGISQYATINQLCGHVSDCVNLYLYNYSKGGVEAQSDEGAGALSTGGGNYQNAMGGTSLTTGTGLTSVSLALPFLDWPQSDAPLMDWEGGPSLSANICGNPNNNTLTDCGTHTVSDAFGHNAAAIETGGPNVNNGGVTVTVPVTVDGGTSGTGFSPVGTSSSSYILGACLDFPEYLGGPTNPITLTTLSGGVQSITAKFRYSHPANFCQFYQDTHGNQGVGDLVADRLPMADVPGWPSSAPFMTGYQIAGAPDATHFYFVSYLAGVGTFVNQSGIYPANHNFGQTITPSLTRTSNVAKMCGIDPAFAYAWVTVAGYDSSFNGDYPTTELDTNGCSTYPNPGSDGPSIATGTITTGGNAGGVNSSGRMNIWPAAYISQVGTTTTTDPNGKPTTTANGQFSLYPNALTVTAGHFLFQAQRMSVGFRSIFTAAKYSQPAPNNMVDVGISGYGVGPGHTAIRIFNPNTFTLYRYGGGRGKVAGPTALSVEGPFQVMLRTPAPLQSGTGIYFQSNTAIEGGFETFYSPLSMAAKGGVTDYTFNYFPALNRLYFGGFFGGAGFQLHNQFDLVHPNSNEYLAAHHLLTNWTDTAAACTDVSGVVGYDATDSNKLVQLPCPASSNPVYINDGSPVTSPHIVINLIELDGSGSAAITLAGAAVYTSSASYSCTANSEGGIEPLQVTYTDGTSFTISGGVGAAAHTVRYICTGN